MNITAVIVIRNEASALLEYFEHVRRFCDEIVVIDQQSTDSSLKIAMKHTDKVFLSKNIGYNELDRGFACKQAKNDWVCTLDPDERYSNEFLEWLPHLMDKCEKEDLDAISCKIQIIWDGIPVKEGAFDQYRLARKTVKQFTRVHTGFAPEKALGTTYTQYHYKNFNNHAENLKHRQKHYNDDRIKKNIWAAHERTEKEINEYNKDWEKEKENIYKELEKYEGEQLEVKI